MNSFSSWNLVEEVNAQLKYLRFIKHSICAVFQCYISCDFTKFVSIVMWLFGSNFPRLPFIYSYIAPEDMPWF